MWGLMSGRFGMTFCHVLDVLCRGFGSSGLQECVRSSLMCGRRVW